MKLQFSFSIRQSYYLVFKADSQVKQSRMKSYHTPLCQVLTSWLPSSFGSSLGILKSSLHYHLKFRSQMITKDSLFWMKSKQRNAMKILVQSLDLISFKKYLCSFVSQGKACCTLNILCRVLMYYQGLPYSGILLGFISKLIFLHLHLLSLYVSSKSFSGCLRIPGKLSSFSLQVLSDYWFDVSIFGGGSICSKLVGPLIVGFS